MARLSVKHGVCAGIAAIALLALPAAAQNADALRARHGALEASLAASPFGRPLLLESSTSASQPQGHVYAVINHPFATVQAALQRAGDWCDVMILQFNVKRCVPAGRGDQSTLQVAAGRKSDQAADDAFQFEFRYALKAARADYLLVQMSAEEGPLGTRDYLLALEAVPLDARRSFVHLSYSYSAGVAARLATEAYLATTGRHKVGFSIVGRDERGGARYVGGIRGVAERNTMRYFLGIEALLDALAVPGDRQLEARLRDWFAATERYARQLHEMDLDDYLAMKRREVRQQLSEARPG
jgi:hypothetical protein